MALFDVPLRATKEDDSKIAKKAKAKAKPTQLTKVGGLLGSIELIRNTVEKYLGCYKDDYICITDKDSLHNYIDVCIDNTYISIDTETTGLNPLVDIIAGICIYTYGQKGAYIPINHVSYITGIKSEGQLDADIIIREFERLIEYKPNIDMFNAQFDIRVLRHFGLHNIYCTWDCQLAARILNENELKGKGNLKALHNKYCLGGKGDAFRYDDLFKGIQFTKIPYNVGYLYAARDGVITSELGDFQRKHLSLNSDREDIRRMAWVFHNIEMPLVKVVCDMEDVGVAFDFNKNAELKEKYHKLLDEREKAFFACCEKYSTQINAYRIKNPNVLNNPININSVPQLQALLFDIIGLVGQPDKKTKQPSRSTDKDALDYLKDNEVVKAIMDYREFSTIVSTFIDTLPNCVHTDGRIHCEFNQYGADTGRFSSSNPNLQNIPSHNKEIRQMFKATDSEEYVYDKDNSFTVDKFCEVNTKSGWVYAGNLLVGDILVVSEDDEEVEIVVSKIEAVIDRNQIVIYY